ncbi:hexose transporter [Trypanosoma theileri]|uniref:Hexose transporter n=1 Tax=Trypanosoma theileri TaxID=67003 RepID=A0A1X0NLE0_9TRYP|nr:hexose transporter [Trypanosoma theileri]ORC85582.1 hexose transporter [Trypanosoma theileri]
MTTAPAEYPIEEKRPDDAPVTSDEAPAFCSLENLKVAQVQAVGGTLCGLSIGFVAVYAHLFLTSTDCSLYKTTTACDHVANADCAWNTVSNVCGWKDFTCELVYNTESACLADDRCNWVYSDKYCKNPIGYSATYNGIFAGALVLGATIGSVVAGRFVARFGHKVSFIVCGIVGVVSSVMYHASAATNQFWVLCVGRLLIGIVMGVVTVTCTVYVDQNAHPKNSKVVGVLFQVFTTFGIAFAALMGLALGQSVNFNKNTMMVARMEGFCAFTTLISVIMIFLGIFLGESKTRFIGGTGAGEDALDLDEYGYVKMIVPLLMGASLGGTSQLTGINAVMNYAPTIMSRLGMEPLVGSFVVMLWNFVTTLVSIPLASCFTMRQLFISCSLVASLACLFLCGVPVYPGVASENVKNGVAITGIAVFIAAFEFGIGPCFFVLAQDLFPRSFRPKGSSFVMMMQFIFNIIINVCYPIATERISGGPSGNQDKGQAIAFIFFGCIGMICFVLQVFFLYPWEEREAKARAQHPAEDLPEEIEEDSPIEVATPQNRRAA